MSDLLSIFGSDIFPIFAIAGVGYLLARFLGANVQTVAHVVFYAALPCLAFELLVNAPRGAPHLGRLILVGVVMTVAMCLAGYLVGTALRLARPDLRAFMLVVTFSNSGNFGLPVLQFAYGTEALTYGAVFFLTGSALTYTLGAFLAAGARQHPRRAVLNVLRMPTLYAVLLALIVIAANVSVPTPVMRTVGLLGDAALPMMIVVLGMQLERATVPARPLVVGAAVVVSLVVSPLVAISLANGFDLTGAARQAAITLSSMPVAVSTTILALEFDLAPDFVTSAVFVSTLLSPLTLTPLIAYLR
jgi:predicted permease